MTQATQRITYATMAADPNIHVEFDAAIERVKGTLGRTYPMYINGEPASSSTIAVRLTPASSSDGFSRAGANMPVRPSTRHVHRRRPGPQPRGKSACACSRSCATRSGRTNTISPPP